MAHCALMNASGQLELTMSQCMEKFNTNVRARRVTAVKTANRSAPCRQQRFCAGISSFGASKLKSRA